MFKFLRKYNKWILAVGGTLLMIVFLIPQAIEGLAQSAGTARATRAVVVDSAGRETTITAGQWEQINAEFDLINRRSQFGPLIPAVGNLENASHWFLLAHEAEQAGLVAPVGASQISASLLGGDPRTAGRAVAKLEGIYRLLGLYQSAGAVSDHRLRQYARRMLHQAEIEAVVIPASPDESNYQPTEAELQAQLVAYGSLRPGEGNMGFGYRMPHRVKLEWLAVPAQTVRNAIAQSGQIDNVALRAHWMRELRNNRTSLPPMTDDPEIPETVREHLLDRLTQEQLQAISRFAHDQFRANRRGLVQRDGYFILPDDWAQRRLSFTAISQEIQNRFSIESPEYHATGERWLVFDDLDELPGIGTATTDRFGSRERDLYDLVSGAVEFGLATSIQVQRGVASPPLQGRDGSVYFFRIVDVDVSRPPHSVDEVRDQLVSDLQRKSHFEQLVGLRSGIEQLARTDGLLAAAIEYGYPMSSVPVTLTDIGELDRQFQMGEALRPVPSRIPGIGVDRDVVDQIIDLALELPTNVAIDELPIEQRVFAIAVEDSLSVLVFQIRQSRPLTRELFAMSAETIRAILLNEELGMNRVREAFSLETLTKRHGFRLFSPITEEEELIDLDELAIGG